MRITRQAAVSKLLDGKPDSPGDAGSAYAPANIALCKYWGKRDSELNLPNTSSLSISLGELGTRTRLSPHSSDRVVLNGEPVPDNHPFSVRLFAFLNLVRRAEDTFLIETENGIPTAAGLASSASGFAALVMALDHLYGWGLKSAEKSILARMGSGSACRSIHQGFVLWERGESDDGMDSYARPLPAIWPDLRVGLLVLQSGKKPVSSTEGMNRTVATSILYESWPKQVEEDLSVLRSAVKTHDFTKLGEVAEGNALAMHATMFAARPPVIYWTPETVQTIQRVLELRRNGVEVYLTMDAGPNVKLLFMDQDEVALKAEFPEMTVCKPFGDGATK
jgi:diphosphomevalonate decarboxylase